MRTTIVVLSVLGALLATGCLSEEEEARQGDSEVESAEDAAVETDSETSAVTSLPSYCNVTKTWSASSVAFEDQVLKLVNQRRAAGATCGGVKYGPAAAVVRNDRLRCAARNHSRNMALQNFQDHNNPNGETFGQRIKKAGYVASSSGENVAWGWSTPQQVVEGWMQSTDHCKNVMNKSFTQLGVGHFYQSNDKWHTYWTQNFARPK